MDARHPKHARPLADPAADFWDYADVAHWLGISVDNLKRARKDFEQQGMPRPLPYNRRDCLWRPGSIIDWTEEVEAGLQRHPRQAGLSVVGG